MPVTVTDGRAVYRDQALDIGLHPGSSGPAKLYFRPHDAELAKPGAAGVPAVIAQIRPRGGGVRIHASVEGVEEPIEVDLASSDGLAPGSPVVIRPLRARLFP